MFSFSLQLYWFEIPDLKRRDYDFKRQYMEKKEFFNSWM